MCLQICNNIIVIYLLLDESGSQGAITDDISFGLHRPTPSTTLSIYQPTNHGSITMAVLLRFVAHLAAKFAHMIIWEKNHIDKLWCTAGGKSHVPHKAKKKGLTTVISDVSMIDIYTWRFLLVSKAVSNAIMAYSIPPSSLWAMHNVLL